MPGSGNFNLEHKKILTFRLIIGIIIGRNEFASVAQSVVHLTRNEKVACSSQVTSSIKTPRNHRILGSFLHFWIKIISNYFERICFGVQLTSSFRKNKFLLFCVSRFVPFFANSRFFAQTVLRYVYIAQLHFHRFGEYAVQSTFRKVKSPVWGLCYNGNFPGKSIT